MHGTRHHTLFTVGLSLFFGGIATQSTSHAQESNGAPVVSAAGIKCGCGRWTCPSCQQQLLCPPSAPAIPYQPNPLAESPEGAPIELSPETQPIAPQPPSASLDTSSLFAANLAAAGAGQFGSSTLGATTPEMMGDFFGSAGPGLSVIQRDDETYIVNTPMPGYVLGRMKQAENSSPIPRDRIFFNYSLFDRVPLAPTPVTVNRFTPGFEKTFLNGLASFEMRVPFGTTLDNEILANGSSNTNELLFGNMFFTLKGQLLQGDDWVLTGGASLMVPTAADTLVLDPYSGEQFLRIENQSTHIMPFLGGAFFPNERLFAQWIVQCDIDTNGNRVVATDRGQSTELGTMQDFTLLYTDINVGYWVYRATGPTQSCITGIAPIAEFHYNRSLNTADHLGSVDGPNLIVPTIPALDNINVQCGLVFSLRNRARLGIGYATPIGNGIDRVFQNEFRLTLNRDF